MAKQTVYLDVCCLNRFGDDQSQDRVWLETQALVLIIGHVEAQRLEWLASTAILVEVRRNPNPERSRAVELLLSKASRRLRVTPADRARATTLGKLGFTLFDAAHIAFAERGGADVLLTTDDKFERRAMRYASELTVRVQNPLTWLNQWATT